MLYHPRGIRRGGILSLAVVLCSTTVLVSGNPGGRYFSRSVPTPFQISPARTGNFTQVGAFLNPKSKLFVVFFYEDGTQKQRFYSRLFTGQGKPASGPQLIMELKARTVSRMDSAYNEKDDRFFLAGSDTNYDSVKGMLLDGRGISLHPGRARGEEDLVEIKPATKPYSALNIKVGWIPASNRYMAVWTHREYADPDNPKTGHYLTVLDGSLKTILKTKQVRKQAMLRKSYGVRALVALDNRILWGSAEDCPDYRVGSRPVAWFTDFLGNVLKSYAPSSGGYIYPGGKAEDEHSLFAAYNRKEGLFLLHWTVIDCLALSSAQKADTYFRIMGEDGRFKSSLKIAPKTLFYQYRDLSDYLVSGNRFFLACLEYKSLPKSSTFFWGGKLVGFYINAKGEIEDENGQPSSKPIPLLGQLMDPSSHLNLDALESQTKTEDVFVGYSIGKNSKAERSLWGLLLK